MVTIQTFLILGWHQYFDAGWSARKMYDKYCCSLTKRGIDVSGEGKRGRFKLETPHETSVAKFVFDIKRGSERVVRKGGKEEGKFSTTLAQKFGKDWTICIGVEGPQLPSPYGICLTPQTVWLAGFLSPVEEYWPQGKLGDPE